MPPSWPFTTVPAFNAPPDTTKVTSDLLFEIRLLTPNDKVFVVTFITEVANIPDKSIPFAKDVTPSILSSAFPALTKESADKPLDVMLRLPPVLLNTPAILIVPVPLFCVVSMVKLEPVF